MRFAISLPQVGDFDPVGFRAYLTRAEELGFDSGWTMEQVLGSTPFLSPIETMTFAAACTQRLRLGCAVFVSPQHSPLHLAKSLSTLDHLSGGRLEVGFGTGGRNRDFASFGITPDGLVTRFTEGLRLMRSCWTDPKIDFEGRFWRLTDASMEPKPLQKPHPPVWIGGSHPDAVRRAVRLGDGFFGAGSTTTARFADQVEIARATLESDRFSIAKRVYIAVDDDAARAERRLALHLNQIYGSDLISVGVFGPPDQCVRGLREIIDAGAELILLNPLFDEPTQMERLAAEVLPHLT